MRKQIAAANWKMNKTLQEGQQLLHDIVSKMPSLTNSQHVIFALPYPYLGILKSKVPVQSGQLAAQNCHHASSGAYTGEVSVSMLKSLEIPYCIVGHSERREYFHETNAQLAEKINLCLSVGITPILCCGEPLSIREVNNQNSYVGTQLDESLFHLDAAAIQQVVIAYEPIWAIGTGKTASSEQAQEMHAFIRSAIANKYSAEIANGISILYGGSVKGSNAGELFAQPDVDGGLVGGASLVPEDFLQIIAALKKDS